MTDTDTRPAFVRAEPRYVAGEFGESWHLDGVWWYDVDPPQRRGHKHWAQTVGWIGLDLVCRCPCSAVTYRWPVGWLWVTEREKRWGPSTRADKPVEDARPAVLSFRAFSIRMVVGAWVLDAVAWLVFAFVGGGSINMAVGITLAALITTVIVTIGIATDHEDTGDSPS